MEKGTILKINGKEYPIKFPNVGQFIEIEAMKLSFTKNRYGAAQVSNTKHSNFMLDMADSVSYLSVMIPELKKDLNVEGWWEMELQTAKMINRAYQKEFIPWFKPLIEDLYKYDDDADENDESKK